MSSNLSEPKKTLAFPFTWHTMNGRPKHCKNGEKLCKDVLLYFYNKDILVGKTKGAEMQVKALTLFSSASCVTLFSLSLIGWDLARFRISSTSLVERPAFNPACAKQKDISEHTEVKVCFSTVVKYNGWYQEMFSCI